nr:hypothetical protein [Micromonospora sp. WMMC415]
MSGGAAYRKGARTGAAGGGGTSISGSEPAGACRGVADAHGGGNGQHEEVTMAKKARKKKARKKSSANHGKRPNS